MRFSGQLLCQCSCCSRLRPYHAQEKVACECESMIVVAPSALVLTGIYSVGKQGGRTSDFEAAADDAKAPRVSTITPGT